MKGLMQTIVSNKVDFIARFLPSYITDVKQINWHDHDNIHVHGVIKIRKRFTHRCSREEFTLSYSGVIAWANNVNLYKFVGGLNHAN